MSHMNRPLIALALVAIVIPTNAAHAQRNAGSKITGEAYNFYSKSAGSSMRAARDYSNYYTQYAQSVPAQDFNPEVAREAADAIGTYITKARRHMAWMRTHAKASDDKATLASLDEIDKNLAAAAKSHHEMYEHGLKDNMDIATSIKHSQVIDKPLAAAIADHDTLMKKLAADKAPAPKK